MVREGRMRVRESSQRSYNRRGNPSKKPQILGKMKEDTEIMGERRAATIEEKVEGFIAQVMEPNRSSINPPRKQKS